MKKYYKVDLYSVDLEKEKQLQNEYEKGNNMSLILKCCSKRKVGSVIVYRTNIFKDKYREMITKMEIPGLIYSFWNGIYMTKNFPLFFVAKYDDDYGYKNFDKIENLIATSNDINDYLYKHLKSEVSNNNYYKDAKKVYKNKLNSLFNNAMQEY